MCLARKYVRTVYRTSYQVPPYGPTGPYEYPRTYGSTAQACQACSKSLRFRRHLCSRSNQLKQSSTQVLSPVLSHEMVFSHASSSATRSLLLRPSTSSSSSVVGVGRSHQSGAVRCFSATRRAEIARASLVGTLVAAPEERTTDNGLESIRLKLASDWGPSTQRRTDWWTVHSYRKDPLAKQRMMSLKIG